MRLILLIAEVELFVQPFRMTELVMVSGERVLCLNEKPTLRKDFYWDILRESLDICSALFTVTPSAECFLLRPSVIHMVDDLRLISQKNFPQMEERGRRKPLAIFFC